MPMMRIIPAAPRMPRYVMDEIPLQAWQPSLMTADLHDPGSPAAAVGPPGTYHLPDRHLGSELPHILTTIHNNSLACHEARLIGQHEHDGVCDVFRLAKTSQRDGLRSRVP